MGTIAMAAEHREMEKGFKRNVRLVMDITESLLLAGVIFWILVVSEAIVFK